MHIKNNIFFIFLIVLLCGCSQKPIPKQDQMYVWPVMGTSFEVKWIEGENHRQAAAQKMFEQVRWVDEKVSIYKSQSDLSLLNARSGTQEWTQVDPITLDLLDKSKNAWELTDGCFNIAIGAMAKLWKLNLPVQGQAFSLPSSNMIKSTFDIVKRTRIEIQNDQVRISPTGALLDMGGIAKGYALDLAAAVPTSGCGFLNLGRQMSIFGSCKEALQFGIQDPNDPAEVVAVVEISQGSIASTGNYERYFTNKNKKYGHVFNPKIGKPMETNVSSVTVWAKSATQADVWSTALYIAGPKHGKELIQKNMLDMGAIWILEDHSQIHHQASFGRILPTPQKL